MAALSTRFVFLLTYLQIIVIFNVDGLTLPLKTITTKCESFTKKPQKPNQETVGKEKLAENLKVSADFTQRAAVSPVLNSPNGNGPLLNNQENYCGLSIVSNDLIDPPQTISNSNCMSNLPLTPLNSFVNTRNSITISEPNSLFGSTNFCDNSALPIVSTTPLAANLMNSGLKLPVVVSSSVTSVGPPRVALKPSVINDDSKIGVTIEAPLITSPMPLISPLDHSSSNPTISSFLNPPSSELKVPLDVTISTLNLESNSKPVFTPQNMMLSSSDGNTRPQLPCDTTTFQTQNLNPVLPIKPALPPMVSPINNLPLSSGIAVPLSVTPSVSSLNLHLKLNTPMCSDLQEVIIPNLSCSNFSNSQILKPLDSYSKTFSSSNIPEAPNTKREILTTVSTIPSVCLNPSRFETPLSSPSSVSSLGNSNSLLGSPLREYLKRTMPQTSFLNNMISTDPNFISVMPSSTIPTNESLTNFKSSPNTLSASSCLSQELDLTPSCIFDANKVSAIPPVDFNTAPSPSSFISPLSTLPLSLLTPCSITSVNVDNKSLLAPQYDTKNNLPKTSQSPISSDLITAASYDTNMIPNDQIFRQSNTYSIPPYPDVVASKLPDSNLLATNENPLKSLGIPALSINQNRPLEKYFTEVRALTAKLNEFISSFSSRLGSRKTVTPSFANVLTSPKPLIQPKIMPIVERIAPEIPYISSTINCEDSPSKLLPQQDVEAPKVPQTTVNTYNYPIRSNPAQYYSFQDSIASLSKSNFLPYSFNNFPTSTIPPYPYTSSDIFANVPFLPSKPTFDSFPENPYSRTQSFSSETSVIKRSPSSTSTDPIVTENCSESKSDTSVNFMPNIISDVKSKDISVSKKSLPYISSITINTIPKCENAVADSRIDLPNLTTYRLVPPLSYISPTSLDSLNGSHIDMCCEDIQRLVALLELSLMLDGEANYGLNSMMNI